VTTLRNPLPLDDAPENAPRDGPPSNSAGADDRFVVLSLGDISEEKGVFDTVEAVPQVVADRPEVEFWFAGRGDTDRLERRARVEPWGDRIRVLGWVDGEKKEDVLDRANLLLLPSHAEGLPMSILEGMAHGLPVVASRVGGIPEVITDGKEGLLIEPGEPESIAAAVLRFAEAPAFSRRAGAAGRDRVRREFRRDRVLDSLYGLYERLLPERDRSRQTAAREA
jgi:glycosyltransferase involved in cell wall biosynthesis